MQRRGGDHQLLGQCSRPPATYADLESLRTDVMATAATAQTRSTAHHRVAGDACANRSTADQLLNRQ